MEWESIQSWINRQPWPEHVQTEALLMIQKRINTGLNPLTGSQWKSWAKAKGLTTTIGKV